MTFKYAFRELEFFLKSMSITRSFHLLASFVSYWLSILTRRPLTFGLPYSCSIEPVSLCNLRCPECPVGMGTLNREKGVLTLEKFENWLATIKKHTSYLTLYLQGEPLLNKDLPGMIEMATRSQIYTTISTNAQLLSREIATQLTLSGLKKLIVSVDGIDQETYEVYRKLGQLAKVFEGIDFVMKARREAGINYPLVIIQFIVFRHNETQIEEIKNLGKKMGVKVEIKTAQHYDLSNENPLITSIEKYRRYKSGPNNKWIMKASLKNKCLRLWTTAVITWNGWLIPCCYDKDAVFKMGDLGSSSFSEIWRGEQYMKFRKKVLNSKSSLDMCHNCVG
jgi:radical SAM protein with 4Fe4S-binding SPASM domain